MKASLSLEFIGANTYEYLRGAERLLELIGSPVEVGDRVQGGPWVAELKRCEDGVIRPDWLYGKRDYSKANSKGSRGVYVHYILEEHRLYWVQSPQSWSSTIRYHAAVAADGSIYRLNEDEVQEWLKDL